MSTFRGFALMGAVGLAAACGSSSSGGTPTGSGGASGGTAGSSATGGTGGTSATGGSGGSGGAATSDKVDLLLMIDNSASMADKQEVLAGTVPLLIAKLLEHVKDLHVGIVSSSLGGLGADSCSPAQGGSYNDTMNDGAHLLARNGEPTYQNQGFLAWSDGAPGSTTDFANMVNEVGQNGCGFESQLESWYRFLIDPEPYDQITRGPCFTGDTSNGCATASGVDQTLLGQRAAFLRPDSAVVVVMLTDENDCSTKAGGQFFLSRTAAQGASPFYLPRSTAACDSNPDDVCCTSCGQAPEAGCPSPDPKCSSEGNFYSASDRGDQLNLRCWDQKRRFGIDFLHPIERYVDGLTQLQVENASGTLTPNPLFTDLGGSGAPPRDPSLVFLAGIVGVPWQDLASADTLNDPATLRLKSAAELDATGTWDVILGDPAAHTPPADPLMIESPEARSGTNPVTGAALVPAGAVSPDANPINGHEWSIGDRDDLQYACIFELPTPRDCAGATGSCDCAVAAEYSQKPLCQAPGSTTYGTMQYYAKAFPGLRELAVLRGVGNQAIIGSVCPKQTKDPSQQSYGYGPAIEAILARVFASTR